jgi:D-3-phosphoglycerate dehydrogenase
MATNKRKVMLPHTMGKQGIDLIRAREDIETVIYPAGIKQADFLPLLADCAGIALSGTPYKQTEMDASPAMQVVARIGVGYDAVEVPALTARKVPLMVAGSSNSTSVAEQAFHLIIALAKRNHQMDRLVKDDKWNDRHAAPPMELADKTVLIVGFGRIGTRIAKRCQAMEMQVLVFDPYVKAEAIKAAGCEPVSDLDQALPRADFVTIHCPKTPETVGMFGLERLRRMKRTAYLVCTARGGIIDEKALHTALTDGTLPAAALDVFDREPPDAANPLFKLPNVILSPHIAGVTREAMERMAIEAAKNVLSVFDGQPRKENAVNPEVFG